MVIGQIAAVGFAVIGLVMPFWVWFTNPKARVRHVGGPIGYLKDHVILALPVLPFVGMGFFMLFPMTDGYSEVFLWGCLAFVVGSVSFVMWISTLPIYRRAYDRAGTAKRWAERSEAQ